MKVGGRNVSITKEQVETRMRGIAPDTIQKYSVEVNGVDYPPKQVLSMATGWERTTFTTYEAQRVLNRIGLPSRPTPFEQGASSTELAGQLSDDRLTAIEAALATAQEAIAGLAARVRELEQARQ